MSLIPSSFFGGRRTNVFDPFSLDFWDPFYGFPFPTPRSESANETSAFSKTRIDWKETPEAHVFKVDLLGIKKEAVKVEVEEGRVLQISGERSKEKEEKNDKWHRVERSSGKFLRRFRLPENAKVGECVENFWAKYVRFLIQPNVPSNHGPNSPEKTKSFCLLISGTQMPAKRELGYLTRLIAAGRLDLRSWLGQ
uniref:SHSP domain-containing protein n=1 Tax=Manihot esculenta TaxID=3983 RepID=A0A2C9UMT6_MANES